MGNIIDIATKEIGTKELPPNSNKTKYGQWFGLDGLPWCGIFVSWCYAHANKPLGNIGYTNGYAGVGTALEHFKKLGQITITPISGDIVIFDWNLDGKPEHTGLFVKDNGDKIHFTTIEGNTAIGNDSNGGEVMLRTDRQYKFATFIHPIQNS